MDIHTIYHKDMAKVGKCYSLTGKNDTLGTMMKPATGGKEAVLQISIPLQNIFINLTSCLELF
jgi:hypothetical protein